MEKDKLVYDVNKFTHRGSMNYILQIWGNVNNEEEVTVDQYQPRRNCIWHGEMSTESAKEQVVETIERMKCAINLMQDWLDGKVNEVYYWETEEDRKHNK